MSISYKEIGGKNYNNNSRIYEMFTINYNSHKPTETSLKQVMKTVSHTCSGNPNSKLKIHRNECFHLKNEAQIMSQLDHPNILKITKYLEDSKTGCKLIMPKADTDFYKLLSS